MKLQQSECLEEDNNSNRLMAVSRVALAGNLGLAANCEMMGRTGRQGSIGAEQDNPFVKDHPNQSCGLM